MHCTHSEWVYPEPYCDEYDGWMNPEPYQKSTNEHLDTGRFKCSQCKRIGYYTGQWRDFYEKGIPCPGSDEVVRPKSIRDLADEAGADVYDHDDFKGYVFTIEELHKFVVLVLAQERATCADKR